MKNKTLHILIALTIFASGTTVFADGTKGKKAKETRKEKSANVIDKIADRFDAELNFENWMTEISSFSSTEVVYEKNLILENWMTEVFEIAEIDFSETELALEDWMTTTFEFMSYEEGPELEEWMMNPFEIKSESLLEKDLALENWMLKF